MRNRAYAMSLGCRLATYSIWSGYCVRQAAGQQEQQAKQYYWHDEANAWRLVVLEMKP